MNDADRFNIGVREIACGDVRNERDRAEKQGGANSGRVKGEYSPGTRHAACFT